MPSKTCSIAEWREESSEAITAPAFFRHRRLLVDRRTADVVTVGFVDEVVSVLSAHRDAVAGGRAAIVTTGDVASAWLA